MKGAIAFLHRTGDAIDAGERGAQLGGRPTGVPNECPRVASQRKTVAVFDRLRGVRGRVEEPAEIM